MRDEQLRILSWAALSLIAVTVPAVAVLPPGFAEVSVFATNSIELRASSDVLSGDVVVNTDSPGPI